MDTKSFEKLIHQINSQISFAKQDYERKILDNFCPDLDPITDNLIYRNYSVRFHLELIQDYTDYLTGILKSPEGYRKGSFMSTNSGLKLNFLFDDLIFNMISFYDYFATFIVYFFYGNEIRSTANDYNPLDLKNKRFDHLEKFLRSISWVSVINLAKNSTKDLPKEIKVEPHKFQKSKTSKIVENWHSKFVYKLSQLRNQVIHNQVTPINNVFTYDFVKGGKYDFSIHGQFADLFPDVNNEYGDAVSFLVISYTQSILDSIESLIEDVENNKRVKKEDMFINWKHEIE
jgi:hypothetical protein